jgi:hypothetical protein
MNVIIVYLSTFILFHNHFKFYTLVLLELFYFRIVCEECGNELGRIMYNWCCWDMIQWYYFHCV